MSVLIRCDRCHREVPEDAGTKIEYPLLYRRFGGPPERQDLCLKCSGDLDVFVKTPPVPAVPPE